MAIIPLDIIQLSDWKDIARSKGGFRDWLRFYGLSDDVTARPTEQQAFVNLESEAWAGKLIDVPLSPLEKEILSWERFFMANYRTSEFTRRYGVLSVGQKYAFICEKVPHLGIWQCKSTLEEISDVLDAYSLDVAADALVADAIARRAA